MSCSTTLLVRCAPTDDGLATEKARSIRFRSGGVHRRDDALRIVAVHISYDVPAVGAEARRTVVRKPSGRLAVDGDAIVIIEGNELA